MSKEAKGLDGLYFQKTINIEKVVCELVDNSIDHPKKGEPVEVYILIEEEIHTTDDTHPDSFRIYVFDNGSGFISEDKLHEAFELSSDTASMKKKIGKFHFGMKTAPLYKFNNFSLITKINKKYFNRSIRHPGMYNPENNYLWLESGIDQKHPSPNPTDKVPKHVGEKRITDLMDQYALTTCAVCTTPRMSLLKKDNSSKDITYFDELIEQLKLYLGIVYQEAIEKKKAFIKIGKEMNKMDKILPCDPFLSDYTPNGMASLAKIEKDVDNKMMLETIAPFGTLAGERKICNVKIPNIAKYKNQSDQIIHVTPYFVPSASFVDLLRKSYAAFDLKGRYIMPSHNKGQVSPKQKEISSAMGGKGMQGFYFYRGGRAIIFGAEPADSNQGFWNGISGFKSFSSTGWANNIRIKVEYEPSPELDEMFKIASNKETFDGSPHENIWAAIKTGIMQVIDGQTANHAAPLNTALPFWVPGEKKNFHIGTLKDYPPSKCDDCSLFHESGKCPKGDCSECGLLKAKNNCTVSTCNTRCINPKCGETGHTEEVCPQSKCPNCTGYIGFPSCYCCKTCKKPCLCPHGACHTTPCKCGGGGGGGSPPPANLFKIQKKGKYHRVKFDSADKAKSIKMINEILLLIGKSKDDL